MTKAAWRIAPVTPEFTADDMTGKGAETTGGRWNDKGIAAVYASENIALACLETIAHFGTSGLPLNRYLVRIDIPDDVFAARRIIDPCPAGWDAEPYGLPSLRAGAAWVKDGTAAVLDVPSAIVPEERNILINPRHPDAAKIKAGIVRRWLYDPRLRKV